MGRDEAIQLLRRGPDGIRQWNEDRERNREIPCLQGADLRNADLRRADLSEAKLNGAFLNDAKLQKADLSGANLTAANLRGAQLFEAKLVGSNFTNADLGKADLRGANLSNSWLYDANLYKADLRRANLDSAICDNAVFTRAIGLYGRHQIRAPGLEGADTAHYSFYWDLPRWSLIRNVGALPLFGASYLGIISIWIWATSVELLNYYLEMLKERDATKSTSALPVIPLPEHMGLTLVALLLLAAAATLYKLACPSEIQESSETRWVFELEQPSIVYRSLSCSRCITRWATAICYAIGGPWVIYLLASRVFATLSVLLS